MRKINMVRVFDALFDFWCLVWFCIPVSLGPGGIGGAETPIVMYPFMMPYFLYSHGNSIVSLFFFLIYLIPVYGLSKLSLAFGYLINDGKKGTLFVLDNPSGLFTLIARVIITVLIYGALIFPMLLWADYDGWFNTYPTTAKVSFFVTLAFNFIAMYFLIQFFTIKSPAYAEYKNFSETIEQNTSQSDHTEFLFNIRTKLFVAFVGIIAVILVSLSFLILGRYKKTIMELVEDTAHSQVVQASSAYRINLGDTIAMYEYMNRHVQLNEEADFAYDELNIYTSLKPVLYTDDLPDEMPVFKAEFSTEKPSEHFPHLPPLSGKEAAELIYTYKINGFVPVQIIKSGYRFVEPILKMDSVRVDGERVKRERLLGFSIINFNRDIVMRSFFKTRISVFVFTGLFLYLAVLLTYVIGSYIVNPLLFLRMNVRKISDILSGMMSGTQRISSSQLVYKDYVKSRDEIKSLSGEISNMVGVIRGIIPYISASTLKQAETGTSSAPTEKKELTFLFTDIRGFTTLCEGRPPEEVVDILNHYLDLETEIILNNHGDIDKFVGDEMMAFFDGPDKEKNACYAAMQIRAAMMAEREKCLQTGKPVISIGIGINTGEVVFGSVGARDRRDFTSIGDTVNLAARLEGANKAYLSKTIITDAVYKKIEGDFICRELDFIAVKGKTEPVRIYELLQVTTRAQPRITEIKTFFEKGLAEYRKQHWAKASPLFQKNIDKYNDDPSAVFLDRVAHFEKDPPSDKWDGVFRMKVK